MKTWTNQEWEVWLKGKATRAICPHGPGNTHTPEGPFPCQKKAEEEGNTHVHARRMGTFNLIFIEELLRISHWLGAIKDGNSTYR